MTPFLLTALLAVQLVACSQPVPTASEDPARRDALVTAVREAELGATLDLRSVLGSDWDRVAFLGPYSFNERTEELLGLPFDIERVSPWTHTEGGNVIVLARGQEVVSWFGVPDADVPMTCMGDVVLPAGDATMTVVGPNGELAAERHPPCHYLFE